MGCTALSQPSFRRVAPPAAGFLTTLEEWLDAAWRHEQFTLLRQVLLAFAALPLEPSLLRSGGCASLLRAVRKLQGHPHAAVAKTAAALHVDWQQRLQGSISSVTAPKKVHSQSLQHQQGVQQAQAQAQAQAQHQQSVRPLQPSVGSGVGGSGRHALPELVPLGRRSSGAGSSGGAAAHRPGSGQSGATGGGNAARAAHVQRPLSADDIHRERQRKHAQAQLQQLQQLREHEQAAALSAPSPTAAAAQQPDAQASPQQGGQGAPVVHERPLFRKVLQSLGAVKAVPPGAASTSSDNGSPVQPGGV